MVEASKRINGVWIQNKQADFIHASIDNLPFEKNSFDKIFTLNTIYFWDNEQAALTELKRVLAPEGLLIIALRPKRQMLTYPFTQYGFNMFSKEEVHLLLKENGLTVLNIYENHEPPFELNGETIRMENLIVVSKKD
jgi:ubiquinone/menaquinone biosynthesis C-methylase UbiE